MKDCDFKDGIFLHYQNVVEANFAKYFIDLFEKLYTALKMMCFQGRHTFSVVFSIQSQKRRSA